MTSINKLPKGLILAHINICSLRHKTQELAQFLKLNKVDILAIPETHLDSIIDNSEINLAGFSVYRNDRNRFGGGVAIYIREHLPVKSRKCSVSGNMLLISWKSITRIMQWQPGV